MCGLTGYLLLDGNSEINSSLISEMLVLQKHRGPDDSGILGINTHKNFFEVATNGANHSFNNNPNLIFGFNRLSILDLSLNGHQPMISYESGVALMMNGEIYNAFDFKPELLAKGYKFKGTSDTEVVLYLYLEYGLDAMLKKLNGMFALAIYDGRQGKLFLVRDRFGIKPLYVFRSKDEIAFSSELKSFFPLRINFNLNQSLLSEFLLYRNVINNTLIDGVKNLEPGTYLSIDAFGTVTQFKFYDILSVGENQNKITSTGEWLDYLKSSVKSQLISDVKLGCQLSGGVDSSVVTAIASEYLPSGLLETVSIVFDEESFTEKPYIDQVVNKFNLVSHQFKMSPEMYFGLIDSSIWHFEQPLNHPNTIGINLLSKNARQYLTVLLSGEGADELLGGYERFIPKNVLSSTYELLLTAKRNYTGFPAFMKFLENPGFRYLLSSSFGSFNALKTLFPDFSLESGISSRETYWRIIPDSDQAKKRKYEMLTYLPDLLVRQDKMSMAHSIENRVPFLDNDLVSASFNLSDSQLFGSYKGKNSGKLILKEVCSKYLGGNFSFRRKMGFSIPMRAFFASNYFKERWYSELLPAIKKRGLFESKQLEQWMNNPLSISPDKVDGIWLMVGFEIWAQKFLDNK